MDQQIPEDRFAHTWLPVTSIQNGVTRRVSQDLYCLTVQIVNVCFVGQADSWVLVDAGMPNSEEMILSEAKVIFGANPPKCIVLTHGHFDHVGAIAQLLKQWNVPVYAHQLEMPYLTGKADYPPADISPDGLVAKMSPMFPRVGIDLGEYVHSLPDDGTIPGLPGWQWIPTPGHTPGHISLFRHEDRTLIAGDAFVTVEQESLYKVLVQEQEISGPPAYFTMNWEDAWESVRRLEKLQPLIAVTGHGTPVAGERLTEGLAKLIKNEST